MSGIMEGERLEPPRLRLRLSQELWELPSCRALGSDRINSILPKSRGGRSVMRGRMQESALPQQ